LVAAVAVKAACSKTARSEQQNLIFKFRHLDTNCFIFVNFCWNYFEITSWKLQTLVFSFSVNNSGKKFCSLKN
jgi:hypothetical protein